jgi:hypothetical protein
MLQAQAQHRLVMLQAQAQHRLVMLQAQAQHRLVMLQAQAQHRLVTDQALLPMLHQHNNNQLLVKALYGKEQNPLKRTHYLATQESRLQQFFSQDRTMEYTPAYLPIVQVSQ